MWGGKMKYRVLLFVMLLMVAPSLVSAHVVNKENVYDDIQYSEAAEDIVLLSGIGIIDYEHGDSLFRPQDRLTRGELIEWAASFLSQSNQDKDLVKGEFESGLISSLEGNATYEDVGNAFFKGKLHLDEPDAEMTREEFVKFMAGNLEVEIDGETLLGQAGLLPGPKGIISSVKADGDYTYRLKIGNKEYLLDPHPRVLNGAADPVLWEGKMIEESWFFQTKDGQALKQVKFGNGSAKEEKSVVLNQDKDESEGQPDLDFPVILTIVAGCIVLIYLFGKFKKHKYNKQ